jgi:hypothetical protein
MVHMNGKSMFPRAFSFIQSQIAGRSRSRTGELRTTIGNTSFAVRHTIASTPFTSGQDKFLAIVPDLHEMKLFVALQEFCMLMSLMPDFTFHAVDFADYGRCCSYFHRQN